MKERAGVKALREPGRLQGYVLAVGHHRGGWADGLAGTQHPRHENSVGYRLPTDILGCGTLIDGEGVAISGTRVCGRGKAFSVTPTDFARVLPVFTVR